jgi:hypothetical protein
MTLAGYSNGLRAYVSLGSLMVCQFAVFVSIPTALAEMSSQG